MATLTIGVPNQDTPGERRVALVPEVVAKLCAQGRRVLVESGAGAGAWLPNSAYADAGASIVTAGQLYDHADVVACVHPPAHESLHSGQTVLGLLRPALHPALIQGWADRGITALALERLPRKLSRAQTMDALTSQANITGYKSVLVAANSYGGYLPMLMTAAGTVRPATVLVLGAGVAGLQAIGTARRLGAVVTGYDIRAAAKAEITSLGAKFLELPGPADAGDAGGYARALTEAERQAQQRALDAEIGTFDIVITAAGLPDGRPPVLVTEAALAGMRPGSVVVDTMRGPLGGNVALSEQDVTVTVPPGVIVIGAGNLPSTMPAAASAAYARNIAATIDHLLHDGPGPIDLSDEIAAAIVLTHGGAIRNQKLEPVA